MPKAKERAKPRKDSFRQLAAEGWTLKGKRKFTIKQMKEAVRKGKKYPNGFPEIVLLGNDGSQEAIEALVKYGLPRKDEATMHVTSFQAMESLKQIGDRSIDTIIKLGIKSKNLFAAQQSIYALKHLKSEKATDAIIKHGLTDKREDVVTESIKMLSHIKTPKSINAMIKFGNKTQNDVYLTHAIMRLGETRSDKAIPLIVKRGIRNKYSIIWQTAIDALEKIRTPKAVEALIKHGLKRKNTYIVYDSVYTLGELKAREAIPAIEKYVLKKEKKAWTKNPNLVHNCINALYEIGGPKSVSSIVKYGLTYEADKKVKGLSVKLLGLLGDKKAVKPLIKYGFSDKNNHIVNETIETIMELDPSQGIPALVEHGLAHSHYAIQELSKDHLKRFIYQKTITKALIQYGLKHEKKSVVETSVKLIGKISDKRALPALMTMTGHENKELNTIVKESIKKIQEREKNAERN